MAKLEDLLGVGTQIFDYGQRAYNIEQARDDINQAYDRGERKVEQYADPWIEQGLRAAEGYEGLGEFDFDFDDYLTSDYFDWNRELGQTGLERSAAAGPQGLYSGKTLADISEYNWMYGGGQYGAEHGRQLAEYAADKDYYQYPMGIGSQLAGQTGQTLADLAIGRGSNRASLQLAQSQALSNFLGSAGVAGQDQESLIDSILGIAEDLGITDPADVVELAKKAGIGGAAGDLATMFGDAAKVAAGGTVGAGAGAIGGDAWVKGGWTSPFAGPKQITSAVTGGATPTTGGFTGAELHAGAAPDTLAGKMSTALKGFDVAKFGVGAIFAAAGFNILKGIFGSNGPSKASQYKDSFRSTGDPIGAGLGLLEEGKAHNPTATDGMAWAISKMDKAEAQAHPQAMEAITAMVENVNLSTPHTLHGKRYEAMKKFGLGKEWMTYLREFEKYKDAIGAAPDWDADNPSFKQVAIDPEVARQKYENAQQVLINKAHGMYDLAGIM